MDITILTDELLRPEYKGLDDAAAVDALNNPRQVATQTVYRAVTMEEVCDAIGQGALAELALSLETYAAAPQEADRQAAVPGAALYERLTGIGTVNVAPGSEGRAVLDAAQVAGYLSADELAAIVAIGTGEVPVLESFWQTWGWDESVRLAQVKEARS